MLHEKMKSFLDFCVYKLISCMKFKRQGVVNMVNIKVDIQKFQNINFEETLNYKHDAELESAIADAMEYLEIDMNLLSRKRIKVTYEQRMVYFLKKALLSITTDPICIKAIEECSTPLDSDYIHTILKKHYYNLEFDFDCLIEQ